MKAMFEKYRVHAGLMLLVLVALYANMGMLNHSVRNFPDRGRMDNVSVYEARMTRAKADLARYREVGYATTVDSDRIFGREKSFDDVEILAQYILAQYSLAPVVIRNSTGLQMVIGNFVDGPPDPEYLKRNGLIPVKDYGDGLVLYTKEGRR